MKKQTISILIIAVLLSSFGQIFAQNKITLEMTNLPDGFEAHNPAILFGKINALAKLNKSNKKTIEEFLKGKKIYQNLTTDDLFAFSPDESQGIAGRTINNNLIYAASLYPFINLEKTPSPKPKYLGNYYWVSIGFPIISSPDDLVSEYIPELDLQTFWTTHYLPIQTVYPAQAIRKKYIGNKNVGAYTSSSRNKFCELDGFCVEDVFIVPSPQIHYGLGFVNEQPFPLVNATDSVFSTETYQYQKQKGAGLAALYNNGDKYPYAETLFIVKPVAPYIAVKNFKAWDAVEKKPHLAVRNVLYVKLIGIWLYDRNSGQIVSKNGEKMTQ